MKLKETAQIELSLNDSPMYVLIECLLHMSDKRKAHKITGYICMPCTILTQHELNLSLVKCVISN